MNKDFCVNVLQKTAKLLHNIQELLVFNLRTIPFFPKEGKIEEPHKNACI
jgi:hypothetical protein